MLITITIKSDTAKDPAVLLGFAISCLTMDLTDEDINSGNVDISGHGLELSLKITERPVSTSPCVKCRAHTKTVKQECTICKTYKD